MLCFTETWLSHDDSNIYNFFDYIHIPSIRNGKGGGTSIFIKNNINFTTRDDIKAELWMDRTFEVTAIEIEREKYKNLLISCIYRSPDSPINNFIKQLDILMDKALKEKKMLLVAGDFNVDLKLNNRSVQELKTTISTSGFHYLINKPTRVTKLSQSCIDNLLINDSDNVNSAGILELDISDHFAVYVDLNLHPSKNTDTQRISSLKRVKTEAANADFVNLIAKEKWTPIYNESEADGKYNKFINTFVGYMNMCYPIKKMSITEKQKNPWYTPELKSLNSLKNSIYILSKTYANMEAIYSKIKAHYNTAIKTTKRQYYYRVFQKNKNDTRKTWQTINGLAGRKKMKPQIQLQITDKDKIMTDAKNVADFLNEHFINIGNSLKIDVSKNTQLVNPITEQQHSFVLFSVTEQDVIKVIKEQKNNKSPGYDEIPSELLKLTSAHIAKVLTHIFNTSFETGVFPSRMKIAKVRPIYKKGNHLEAHNYRPISLLPVLSKCLEKPMANRLHSYLNKYNLITPSQFGFQKNKSTTDAIHSFMQKLTAHLQNSHVISIFCDLSKAFDCVNHRILLYKLQKMGIRGIPLMWFESYLKDRLQYTAVTKYITTGNETLATTTTSELKYIIRGVPQGSILGPVLFNIYLNDLPNYNSNNDYVLYADDTNLLISDKDLSTLENKFESSLNNTNAWFKNNQLSMNEDKTQFIYFNEGGQNSQNMLNKFSSIKMIDNSRFLGITISSDLKWENHINQIESKIKPAIGILYKLRNIVDIPTLLQIYYSLIHSHLSYGIIIWGGSPQKLMERLLKLQKKAVRIIDRKDRRTSCRPLFRKHKILTVTSLYILEASKYAKKSMQMDQTKHKQTLLKTHAIHSHNTRQRNDIFIPNIPTKQRRNNVTYNCSVIYNRLPNSIKVLTNMNQFKAATKKFLLEKTLYTTQELQINNN